MTFVQFIKSKSAKELAQFAGRCGTTAKYISAHLVTAKKEPRKELRLALIRESNGSLSEDEIIRHFKLFENAD